jgi:UrcA family protein
MSRSKKLYKVIPCAMAVLLVNSLGGVAAAAERTDNVPTRMVQYADLDLTQDQDVAKLYSRIKHAAAQVCEPMTIRALDLVSHSRRCTQQAIARAIADVNSPRLGNLYLAMTSRATTDGLR